ncbi:hypothetical protein SmJEL517_g06168 [Synchytrium microbalum]|uniref:Peroxidase n=1 Tax=Synchytrium microbalum TaxID=1806994 RepID=A0A507BSX0_9FUNG|nr:uncharacterized protein SmJEL517_g06168 [Synchytrium microbalum]TPX30229.1 hypothetical protein SmJEL517_g06168 [Synchytrium microbalum]
MLPRFLTILALVSSINGLPTGAPYCDPTLSNAPVLNVFTTFHGAKSAAVQYQLTSSAPSYATGQVMTLSLSGASNANIGGVLIGVRDADGNFVSGMAVPTIGTFKSCVNGGVGSGMTITHSALNTLAKIDIAFTPPAGTLGALTVSAIVVSQGLGTPWSTAVMTINAGGAAGVGKPAPEPCCGKPKPAPAPASSGPAPQSTGPAGNYDAVRADIAAILNNEAWDDGSLGPIFVRLAWHTSGSFDPVMKNGGSNGATMRFQPEASDPHNNGLPAARAFLEPVRAKNPWISRGDLWTLAGEVQSYHGSIDVTPQQVAANPAIVPPLNRLPNAELGATHIRTIFGRMNFTDAEMVALIGAHSLGRAHSGNSGYVGAWTATPTKMNNLFFTNLVNIKWTPNVPNATVTKMQYQDPTGQLMMLPTDIALTTDPIFNKQVQKYANDNNVFTADFASAFGKLIALGT